MEKFISCNQLAGEVIEALERFKCSADKHSLVCVLVEENLWISDGVLPTFRVKFGPGRRNNWDPSARPQSTILGCPIFLTKDDLGPKGYVVMTTPDRRSGRGCRRNPFRRTRRGEEVMAYSGGDRRGN